MARTTKPAHPAQHMASQHPRGLRAVWCTCGQPVLQGDDEDDGAMIVRVDIRPTNTLGEAIARLNGRNTYDLRKHNGVFQIMRRNRWTITSRQPGTRIWCSRIDVLVEHVCMAGDLPRVPSVHPTPAPTLGAFDDVAPF